MYIILTLFLGIAAVNTGNNLIYLLVAALLSFLSVSGFFGRYNLKDLRVTYTLPEEVYARRDTPLFLHLHNDRRRYPAFLLRVVDQERTISFPLLSPGGSASSPISWRYEERGMQTVPFMHLASPFPFNFFIRFKELPQYPEMVIVFPEPRRGQFPDEATNARQNQGEQDRNAKGFEGDIIFVRDYQAGDPLRFIHWKASARTGSLKTKELGMSTVGPLLLDLDLLPGPDVEKKLSHLSFLIKNTMKDIKPVGLKLGEDLYGPGQTREHKLKLLKALAMYGRNEAPL